MDFSGCLNDDSLGPAVEGCRGDFDFTIKFEKIFMSIIPSAIFVAVSLPRIVQLHRRPAIIGGALLRSAKLTTISAYAILQLCLLVLSCVKARKFEVFFISSAALTLVSAFCMIVLSFLEHSRSLRPSVLIDAYLFLTILFDIAQTRTLWLASTNTDETTFSRVFTAALAVKALLILLESQHKARWVVRWDVKQHSPEETTGLFGLGVFFWLNRLFAAGFKKVLSLDDLFPLDQNMSSEALHGKLADHLDASSFKGQKLGLAKAVVRALAVPLLLPVGPRIAMTAFQFCQPFLINTLLDYLQQPVEESSRNVGYGLIGATLFIYTGIAISGAFYWYFQERAVYMARGVLGTAIYRKTTDAALAAADDSAALTLMSSDIERIIRGCLYIHEFWANIIEVALASWLLSRQIGAAFAAPLVVVGLCVACSTVLSRYTIPRQKAWMERIQKRVGLTSSVIGQMKHIKISGLATPVEESVHHMRLDELKSGAKYRMIIIFAVCIGYLPLCLSPVITFAFAARTLDITTIFTSISYIFLLASPLSILFQMVPPLLAAVACFSRIQTFFEKDSRVDFRRPTVHASRAENSSTDGAEPSNSNTAAIKISNGGFGWESEKLHLLGKIDLDIPASRLTMVIGPIASGKSTLCKALLGETPFFEGEIEVNYKTSLKIGFCDQTPYLSNASIRENIVGFSSFDAVRYNEVVEAAVLQPDLAILPEGDNTNVGSSGISLSGGQKQRVSIARALYLQSNFLVFDDILSGLDADTEEQVFRRVFSSEGLIRRRNATVVLCTHSVRHLPAADHIVALGPDGSLVEQGSFRELLANEKYVHSLGVKDTDDADSKEESITSVEARDSPPRPGPQPAQKANSLALPQGGDHNRMLGDGTVYRHYFSSMHKLTLLGIVVFACGYGFFTNFTTVWLKFWSEDVTSSNPKHSNSYYLGLYGLFQISTVVSLYFLSVIVFTTMISVSGAKLHRETLRTVINAPLRFFITTDIGIVTNLFSQDMTLIDGDLPNAVANLACYIFTVAGMAAVVASSSPWLAVTYPFLAAILYGIQKFYLRTSRQIRLLDLEAKSPLYTHFIDTIKGVATFRAFGWVPDGIELNNQLLDTSQRPAYLLAMIQRWLGFTLSLVVAILAIAVVSLATQLRSNTAFTGASLVTLMKFGEALSVIVRFYTSLETSIGAVSRLKTFSDTVKPENQEGEDVVPPREWPLRGTIKLQGVSASYGPTDESASNTNIATGNDNSSETTARHLALKDLNLTIEPGEKVAICGRSGSGKSSTILLLLRLLDPLPSCAQNITIDDTPLHKIDRSILRQRIIAVPQDAVFLPDGTSFQANLDPFGSSNEAGCRSVLEAVGLWAFVEERGGLAAGMTADTLSQGQKQLFSLARAILRRRIRSSERGDDVEGSDGGVLLLDEVSSSVDKDTDKAMQEIIAHEFAGYTIVMVSHRLDMVMGFDRVMVMDKGEIVEMGQPKVLAETEGSRFRDLWMVGDKTRGP
ncbi:P-loop containing nucleoside triphosphate hydrolase protein [Apodospora peruviana]|uniref:P-loop containing nucleoside triphosphate hydrolase protein n=1 Tax=Apodospora peruviana TaxID=516989 RepID=A0AAE0IJ99_9PEZI|nr:P-loop containing nucleoside triphosphate hydrolase protein [Apodospora peruviana]